MNKIYYFLAGSSLEIPESDWEPWPWRDWLQAVTAHAAADQVMHRALEGLPHFAPKAKSIIYLHMNGGPSQIDMWDYKPVLNDYFDKDLPDSIRKGQRITTMTSGQSRLPVASSKFKFKQYGECGRWVSELLPHTGQLVDDIAVVKTVHTNAINHDPACTFRDDRQRSTGQGKSR